MYNLWLVILTRCYITSAYLSLRGVAELWTERVVERDGVGKFTFPRAVRLRLPFTYHYVCAGVDGGGGEGEAGYTLCGKS